MAVFGIDLGTTYCSLACVNAQRPSIVALEGREATLASVVHFDGSARAIVGRGAARGPCVRGAKNHMGVRARVPGGPPWMVDGRELFATDIAAVLLRAMAERARSQPEVPSIERVVLTHPQRFRNAEKLATAQAARIAGLELAGLITEPDAAAWAYGLHERGRGAGTFMVFDFGGGTLDVTVLRRNVHADGAVEIRALGSYGVQLGGLQLDDRVRDALVQRYRREANDPGFDTDRLDETSHAELLALAESFKIDLNRGAQHDASPLARARSKPFQPRFDDGRTGASTRLKLTLGELNACIAPEVDRAMACAEEALRRCAAGWDAVDEVLLTGGSSQLLLVQQRMRERCGDRVQIVFDEQDHPLRPSTIVAAGAAIFGTSLGGASLPAPIDVRGVVPDAFSVRAFVADATVPEGRRAVLHPIVEAGTPTPYTGRAQFVMRGAGRTLPIEVFEGAAMEDATPVGTFRLELSERVPDGTRVDVTLKVAANGALSIVLHDAASATPREALLTDAPGLYAESELEERRRWLDGLAIEVKGA